MYSASMGNLNDGLSYTELFNNYFEMKGVYNYYLIYAYGKSTYLYDKGKRYSREYSMVSNIEYKSEYRVEVAGAYEQFEAYLRKNPKAKYFCTVCLGLIGKYQEYKKGEFLDYDFAANHKVDAFERIDELILLIRYDAIKGKIWYIDSDCFSSNFYGFRPSTLAEEKRMIAAEVRNPMLAAEKYFKNYEMPNWHRVKAGEWLS